MSLEEKAKEKYCMKKTLLLITLLLLAVTLASCQFGSGGNANTTTPTVTTESTTPSGNIEATTPVENDQTTPSQTPDVTTPEAGGEACKHIFVHTVIAPTCEENGYTSHVCAWCGYGYEDAQTEARGHQYGEWEVAFEATLTTQGKRTQTCSLCDDVISEYYQHEWNENANTDMLDFREDYDGCKVSLKYEYIDYTGEIRIPAVSPEGNIVQSVGGFGYSKVSAIHMPDTTVEIRERAFESCPNLTSLTIPKNVKNVGRNILADSPNVKTVYFLAVACSWYQSSWGEGSAIEHLVVGDDLNYFPGKTFLNYTSLKSVVFGKNVKRIGDEAFSGATNLTSVTFSEGLEQIGTYAFYQTGLTSYTLPNSLTEVAFGGLAYTPLDCDQLIIPANLKTVGGSAFASNGRVGELVYLAEKVTEFTSMAAYAPFGGMTIEKITISPNVRVLGEYTFAGINGPKEITVNIAGDTLPQGLFYENVTVEKVVLGENIKKLSSYVFSGCTNLKEIEGIEQITHLGSSCFTDCKGITFFDFTHLEEWGPYAFNGSGLCEVVLPDDMTVLPQSAFSGCGELKTVTLPAGLTTVSGSAFFGSGIETIVLPDTVTEIGIYAFRYCYNLKEIKLPASLKKVGDFIFEQCTSLKTVELPEGLETMCSFFGCTSLESITIPSTVTKIPQNCFNGCTSLAQVTVLAPITQIPYGMFSYCSALQSFVIPESVVTIGDSAFYECASLQSIVIPNACTTIGRSAFYGCKQLQSVNFGNSLTTVGNGAFSFCSSLVEVTLPDTVLRIEDGAFFNCTSLQKVYLGTSVEFVGDSAFRNCAAIKTMFLPSSLSGISASGYYWGVFDGCDELVIYTDISKIPTAWATIFGASILKGYTYEQYLELVEKTNASS